MVVSVQDEIVKIAKASNYPVKAYELAFEVVDFCQDERKKHSRMGQGKDNNQNHVSPEYIVENFIKMCRISFGPLAYEVVKNLKIYTAEDLGKIIFNLVNKGLLKASDKDSLQRFIDTNKDFLDEFNFTNALKLVCEEIKNFDISKATFRSK